MNFKQEIKLLSQLPDCNVGTVICRRLFAVFVEIGYSTAGPALVLVPEFADARETAHRLRCRKTRKFSVFIGCAVEFNGIGHRDSRQTACGHTGIQTLDPLVVESRNNLDRSAGPNGNPKRERGDESRQSLADAF